MKDYGYKVCYREQGRSRLKVYLVTNRRDSALWHIRWYENNAPPNRKTGVPLIDAEWFVIPILTYLEYKRLWRGCPF